MEGVVFGEGLSDEFEGEAETGKHGAQGDELGLRTAAFPLSIGGSSKEADDLRCIGQVDVGAIHSQKTERVFPKHGRGELRFEPVREAFPQVPPEPEGESIPRLAKRFFGDAVTLEPGADDPHQSPCPAEALRHRCGLQAHVHHQPCDDLGDERAISLGRATPRASRRREDLRGQDPAERCQPELLENG